MGFQVIARIRKENLELLVAVRAREANALHAEIYGHCASPVIGHRRQARARTVATSVRPLLAGKNGHLERRLYSPVSLHHPGQSE